MKRALLAATFGALVFLCLRLVSSESTVDSTWFHRRAKLIKHSGFQVPLNGPDTYFLEAEGFGRVRLSWWCLSPHQLVADPQGERLAFSCADRETCVAYLEAATIFLDCPGDPPPARPPPPPDAAGDLLRAAPQLPASAALDWRAVPSFEQALPHLAHQNDFAALSSAVRATLDHAAFARLLVSGFGATVGSDGPRQWSEALASVSAASRAKVWAELTAQRASFTATQSTWYQQLAPDAALPLE